MGRRDLARRGRRGEAWAARALTLAGYRLLDRRWRRPGLEIDLVAADRDGIAFVEVKSRRSLRDGPPESALSSAQLARLHQAAQRWLLDHVGEAQVAWRVDVVAVLLDHRDRPRRITIHRFFEL